MIFFRFFHYLGFALWMGGGWATMMLVIRSRRDTPAVRAGLVRILPAAYTVIGIGAGLTLLSGIGLAAYLARIGLQSRLSETGVIVMQGSGTLAAVIALAIALPTARRLSRLSTGDTPPTSREFERFRKRLAMASSVAGVLGLLALAGVTLF